ncbi:MAG: hypothetical protein Q7V57_07895 [Actinomycetota bacterium]|nr:hypothetical protein [Actinomycetota bacterium]
MSAHIRWKPEPDDHDYPAARDFLELIVPAEVANTMAAAFRTAAPTTRTSKDLLRACGDAALDGDNPHVAKDLHRIRAGEALSPVLLVRGDARSNRPLIIADGFHRICAVHLVHENAEIHCRIIELPA